MLTPSLSYLTQNLQAFHGFKLVLTNAFQEKALMCDIPVTFFLKELRTIQAPGVASTLSSSLYLWHLFKAWIQHLNSKPSLRCLPASQAQDLYRRSTVQCSPDVFWAVIPTSPSQHDQWSEVMGVIVQQHLYGITRAAPALEAHSLCNCHLMVPERPLTCFRNMVPHFFSTGVNKTNKLMQ